MTTRSRLLIRGQVQGVGFRPFAYRLATELGLTGFVRNDNRGVVIEIEGPQAQICGFEQRLPRELRLPARIDELERITLPCERDAEFRILPSDCSGSKETTVLADIAPCAACLSELFEASNRRYRYPFTNCTHCGPRFTIIESVPYDRPNTTMKRFIQCDECQREYDNPLDRRFHAQPNACPKCGPQLRLLSPNGDVVAQEDRALTEAQSRLKQGQILAVLGVGGFQLLVNAEASVAVRELRKRKHRLEKPLAVMVAHLSFAKRLVVLDKEAEALLGSPEAPIVLLRQQPNCPICPEVAPNNPTLGLMLPSSPLHHLLLSDLGFPVVATSGNLSEEPICISPDQALLRLNAVADAFLVHNRPIERHADDSVIAIVDGEPQVHRRARGFAPLPILFRERGPTVLALGGHQKSTIALSVGDRCFLSQHIGDLDTLETRQAYLRVIEDFLRLYDARPVAIAHDLHGDYASTQIAEQLTQKGGRLEGVRTLAIQHHHAHLAACLADAGSTKRVLGVVWDGNGLGTDGTIWGGEFLLGNAEGYERVAHLQPFRLPGGDRSARSPRRVAHALLLQHFPSTWLAQRRTECEALGSEKERQIIETLLNKQLLSPFTSSMGRLFDAVAGLLGLCENATFEGQAAMAVEFAADRDHRDAYAFKLRPATLISTPPGSGVIATTQTQEADCDCRTAASRLTAASVPSGRFAGKKPPVFLACPREVLEAILDDRARGLPVSIISARFHNALAALILEIAEQLEVSSVALTGGCFQNRLLTERCRAVLQASGREVLTHHQIPPNDGGLALGQVAVACSRLARS